MRDGPPNPAYVVEWVRALQVDQISGGVLNVKKEVLKRVQDLKKSYLKFYCTYANLLASQRDYTIAVYKYMLTFWVMEKGDCVNQDQHSSYESFATLANLSENPTKEPARRMKLPSTIKGNRGRARNEPIEPKSAEVSEGEMDCSILDSQDKELIV